GARGEPLLTLDTGAVAHRKGIGELIDPATAKRIYTLVHVDCAVLRGVKDKVPVTRPVRSHAPEEASARSPRRCRAIVRKDGGLPKPGAQQGVVRAVVVIPLGVVGPI